MARPLFIMTSLWQLNVAKLFQKVVAKINNNKEKEEIGQSLGKACYSNNSLPFVLSIVKGVLQLYSSLRHQEWKGHL